jgi:DnaJ-class molecular chaperone
MKITRKRRYEAMLEQGMHSGNTDAKFDPPLLCPRCAGSGHWVEKDQVCFRCSGRGKIAVPSWSSRETQSD